MEACQWPSAGWPLTPTVLVAKLAWVGHAQGLLVALGSGLVSENTQDGTWQSAACVGGARITHEHPACLNIRSSC